MRSIAPAYRSDKYSPRRGISFTYRIGTGKSSSLPTVGAECRIDVKRGPIWASGFGSESYSPDFVKFEFYMEKSALNRLCLQKCAAQSKRVLNESTTAFSNQLGESGRELLHLENDPILL